ncbi:hypothetical protein, partial [Caldilinea sp.]|uniref:hypothetical protein n=1 Tax=Caldilinea sp. TaxID=2293560 RepID=UPI001B0876FE
SGDVGKFPDVTATTCRIFKCSLFNPCSDVVESANVWTISGNLGIVFDVHPIRTPIHEKNADSWESKLSEK